MRAAIKAGDIKKVRALFPNTLLPLDALLAIATQNYSTTPKRAGHLEVVDFLIEQGAKPSCSMLFEAAHDGCQAIVDRLIAGGVEFDIFVTALIGDPKLAANLLQRDRRLAFATAPPKIEHYRDFTPLHCCCLSGLGRQSPSREDQLLEVGRLFLENGADIEAHGTFYDSLVVTPLDMVAHTGGSLRLARLLIDQGAKISGFAFVEAIAHRGRSFANGMALAELFLERGFDINAIAWKGDGTALHGAANSGSMTTVKWLLEHGADVHARGRMGRTPLHLAAERNTSTKTAELLLKAGVDIHATDDSGLTALAIAERHGKTALADWLRMKLAGR